jgi:ABC-type cobalamin/Fe3+-siderophores transport system ATPase subunit
MKLKSIRIEGMQNEERVIDIKFSDLNVSVIYGENGCGKTTLLRLINAVFEQQENTLLNENVEKINIVYTVGNIEKSVHIKKQELYLPIVTDDDENNEEDDEEILLCEYDWSELRNSELAEVTSILFGVNRGITNTINISADYLYNNLSRSRYVDNFRSKDDLHSFCVSLSRNINLSQRRRRGINIKDRYDFTTKVLTIDNVEMNVIEELLLDRFRLAKQVSVMRVQKALFDTLADACNSLDIEETDSNSLEILLNNNKEKLINTLRQMESNTLSDKIISILNAKDIKVITLECANNPLLTKLIVNMSKELDKEELLLQSVTILKDVFNDYIGPNKYIEIADNDIVIKFKDSDESHRIANLSSGERHLLVLLTIFIVEGRERNILMIDEPEISLNIKWQRKLMPLLSELAPNAQIIVASHSPSISKADSNFLVELR